MDVHGLFFFTIALYNISVTASCGDEEVIKHLDSSNLAQIEIIHCLIPRKKIRHKNYR
jgi:hypothetical protein